MCLLLNIVFPMSLYSKLIINVMELTAIEDCHKITFTLYICFVSSQNNLLVNIVYECYAKEPRLLSFERQIQLNHIIYLHIIK